MMSLIRRFRAWLNRMAITHSEVDLVLRYYVKGRAYTTECRDLEHARDLKRYYASEDDVENVEIYIRSCTLRRCQ